MNLKKNLVYNALLTASQLLFPLVTIPYISRVLSPEGVGKVGFADSYTYFFMGVAEFGIITYGIREIVKVKDDKKLLDKLISELIFIQFISSSVTLIFYLGGLFLLNNKFGDYRLMAFSVSLFLANFVYCEWYFWGTERFRYITYRSILVRLAGVVSMFLIVKKETDYYLYYLVIVSGAIVAMVWNFIIVAKNIALIFSQLNIRRHFPQLITINAINLCYIVLIMFDVPLLRINNTEKATGFYVMAIKIVRTASTIITDLLLVLYPYTVHLAKTKTLDEMNIRLNRSGQLMLLISLPLAAGIYLLSGELTAVYLGPSFAKVAENLRILAFFPIVNSMELFLNKQVLMVYHRERDGLKVLFFGTVFFIIVSSLLSNYYGDTGASFAIVLAEFFLLAGNWIYCNKLNKNFRLFNGYTIAGVIGGTLLFYPVIKLINYVPLPVLARFILSIGGCVIIYIAWLLLVVKNTLAMEIYTIARRLFEPGNKTGIK